jgi:hypothetical protein
MPEAGLESASGMNHTTSVGSSDNVFITPQGNPYVPFCRSWKDSDVRLIELRNVDRSFLVQWWQIIVVFAAIHYTVACI